ncbi:MAG: HlyD family efflux transporter periplasmic adaptor subunit, partial [Gemmatimonadetes bacterium]|nr:HlyD family efflux transporter periplasmic adaptor subunit [Gemmatimonadota bacterium]
MAGTNPPPPPDALLHAPTLLSTPRYHRVVRRWVIGIFAVVVVILFLPWQQFVRGNGVVTALAPADRPQAANAVVGGRIVAWHVAEGDLVRAGDLLVTLEEAKQEYLDPLTADRLSAQVEATDAAADAKARKAASLADQIDALERARTLAGEQAVASLEQARLTVAVDSAQVAVARIDSVQAGRQLAARERLHAQGLLSLVDMEAARSKAQSAFAGIVKAENALAKSRASLRKAELDVAAVAAEYDDKLAKARADRAATLAEVSEAAGSLAKLRNSEANIRLRQGLYEVRAPRDGYVVQAIRAGVGEVLKEGEAVVTIMPANPELAVALQVRPMDVPLLTPGRKVRLQFDGWPALQVAGWPSVAV